ncbi:MAG: nucleotidyltransferase [Bacteroidales bacterium]|nr:nucleotidyltransferase [Bacteroidales bacterium]MCF8344490.1 nucleotidyltransferase [Bacteroidales bacterium]MCF8350993.1 nucleotidyltransferase [Bacteroidales bacterium]MCF8376117.1 nucleotidyltransferase [Bacteroidales bacterium]MCF8401430.1 nucleotidyltransferase [Bacteroidales bacterium]
MKPTLLILAAGIGSRYGGVKQMDRIGPSGESIIDYSIYDAIRAGFEKVVFVINKKIEKDFQEIFEKKLIGKIETEYVLQEVTDVPVDYEIHPDRKKPWGTAHAVLVAKKNKINEPFAVINADDFYGAGAYRMLVEYFNSIDPKSNQYAMVAYELDKTLSEHGHVSRGVCTIDNEGFLREVVEHTNIEKINNNIGYKDENGNWNYLPEKTYVSMNFWGFTPGLFDFLEKGFDQFIRENAYDPKAEYYIPTVVTELINNMEATVRVLKSSDQWFGVTYKEDKEDTIEKIKELVDEGKYPLNLWNA